MDHSVLFLSPVDSIIEGIRCALQLRVPVYGVDLDETLRQMKERGLFLSPQDEGALAQLEAKAGRMSNKGPGGIHLMAEGLASVAHPAAKADEAARLNIEYRRELVRWQALPWWKRLRQKKPNPPPGVVA